MKRRRRGSLSDEDREIWDRVARTVSPLHPAPRKTLEEGLKDTTAAAPDPDAASALPLAAKPKPKPARPGPKPLAPLDRRTMRQIGRGAKAIDARIDLHGLSQADAHRRLRAFVIRAQSDGASLVLVITGRGRKPNDAGIFTPEERGVLRRVVPDWLADPALRPLVAGFETAGPAHGGDGAFYVRLRRRRA